MSEQEPKKFGLTSEQLQKVGDALVDSLVADLGDEEHRTASVQEAARKLLKDCGFELGDKAKASLVPLTRGLPHVDSEEIPPVSDSG